MEFGKRELRNSPQVRSLPMRTPGHALPAPHEPAAERSAKALGMLPLTAGGILLALVTLWFVQHLAG
jgi:hypothetical protein